MEKLYDRIDWNNNTSPALNETNLNLMSKAVDDIDDRVVDIAGTVMETVPQIQEDLEKAQDLLEDAEAISTHPPIIGQNGNWWTWDTTIEDYADSGIDAGVSLTIGETTTLPAGSDATVTNTGTATDPVLNFGIPQGAAGQNGADGQDGADGADGVSPTVTIGTITGGHSVTITDADHPVGQTFNVMDGTNGQGVPASGTTGQVLTKASNADYDTTWTTPSGGSGGHTILNGSGSAMVQRSKLQFVGLDVTDDSTNDKTVVTLPTPDYVDEQFDNSKTYSKGMTCIEGNVRYRYKNSTATSGHRPPDTTYWEVLSVADELGWTIIAEINTTNFNYSSAGAYKGARKTISSIADLAKFKELMLVVYYSDEKILGSTNMPISAISNYTNNYLIDFRSSLQLNHTPGAPYRVYFERYNGSYLFDCVDYSETITLAKARIYAR